MEGIGRIASVGAGIGERPDDVGEFDDRTGIAVRDDQGQRIRFGRQSVDEVYRLAVDLCDELRKRVEFGLLGAPVEARRPIVRELSQVLERNAAAPACSPKLTRPPCPRNAVLEVVEGGPPESRCETAECRSSRSLVSLQRERG